MRQHTAMLERFLSSFPFLVWETKVQQQNQVGYLLSPQIPFITIILLRLCHLILYECWISSAEPEHSHLIFTAIHLMFCHPSRITAILSQDARILYNKIQSCWLQNRMMKGGLVGLSRKSWRKMWVILKHLFWREAG